MPLKDRISYDIIPAVQRARLMLGRSSPNEAVRYLVDAAVDRARRMGTAADAQWACADAVIRVRSNAPHEPGSEVFLPMELPVAIVAELAVSAAQEAVHFIMKLERYPGAAVQGADKYLRGFLHASTLLNALATRATVPGLSARLFGRDMTQQQVMNELDARSMRCVLFQMVERDDSRKGHRLPDQLNEENVSEYLVCAFAAALLDRGRHEGKLAAVLSTYQCIDDTFDEIFRAITEVLHGDYRALTNITHEALLDLKTLASATFRSGNIDEAFLLVECTQPLRIAADVCEVLDGSLEDTLHDLLREAGSENARELTEYLLLGAFLASIQRRLSQPYYDESLMVDAMETFGPNVSFWDAARRHCEEAGFTEAGPILDSLQYRACVQADSTLAIYARELCVPVFPNERTREVLLGFVSTLKALTKERAASRYPASLDDSLPDVQMDEQRAAIVGELYEALSAGIQRVFLHRLRQCAELQWMSPRDEIVLFEAYRLLEEHLESRAHVRTASRGPELHL